MIKKTILSVFLLGTLFAYTQVGIGTTSPAAGSILDIDSPDKGILIPRVSLTGTNDITTVTPVTTGLLVFNTVTAGPLGNSVFPGFYYWDAANSLWMRVATGGAVTKDWTVTGNGDLDATDFIGTTNAVDLRFRTNDAQRMVINANGNVGINTAPAERLHVDGNLQLDGAFMPGGDAGNTDQILISKGVGNEPEWGIQVTNLSEIQGIAKYFTSLSIIAIWNNNTNRTWAINAPGVRLESNVNVSFTGFPGNCLIISSISTDTDLIYVSIRNNACGNILPGSSLNISLMVFY